MLIFANYFQSSPRACLINKYSGKNKKCIGKHTLFHTCTHTFLQLFISPCYFEACLCLLASLPQNPFYFLKSASHFLLVRFMCSFHISAVCLTFLRYLLSVFRASYQIFHHVTVNKVNALTSSGVFLLGLSLRHGLDFYLLSPSCNLTVTPNLFNHSFSLLHIQANCASAGLLEGRSSVITLKPLKPPRFSKRDVFDQIALCTCPTA